jgi:protein SERAC1
MNKSEQPNDKRTLMAIHGALFFGVPSQGMDTKAMSVLASNLPSRYTVELLNRDMGHRLRQRQHEEFCKAFPYPESKIIQFYEQNKTRTASGVSC